MAASFLGQVLKRHPLDKEHWPGENLLTDVTAAVLNEIGSSATAVAGFLSDGAEINGVIDATTEQSLGEEGRMDLVLRDEGNLVVWVEIKDAAPESGSQLSTYGRLRDRQRAEGANVFLVYLVPLGSAPASSPGIKTWRWQDLAHFIESWMTDRVDQLAPQERWLLNDYLGYLHERGLAMTEPLPPNLVSIVGQHWKLWEQLQTLHALLENRVAGELGWTPVEGSYWHRSGGTIHVWPAEWWSVFEPAPADRYATCDFEYSLSGLTPDSDQEPTFTAGLVWRQDRGASPWNDSEWLASMRRVRPSDELGGFALDGNHLHRTLPLREVSSGSLNEQAEDMLKLVRGSFEALRNNPPSAAVP